MRFDVKFKVHYPRGGKLYEQATIVFEKAIRNQDELFQVPNPLR